MEMPVYIELLDPMTLSETQLSGYRGWQFEDLEEVFPNPEGLVARHSVASSKVTFMTLVSCVCELLLRCDDFFLLRHLWGLYTASLGSCEPQFIMN